MKLKLLKIFSLFLITSTPVLSLVSCEQDINKKEKEEKWIEDKINKITPTKYTFLENGEKKEEEYNEHYNARYLKNREYKIEIKEIGYIEYVSGEVEALGCPKNTVSLPETISPKINTIRYMFYQNGIFNPTASGLKYWDTSNIKDMSGVFLETTFNEDISKWDVSNVINMEMMFWGCLYFTQDLSNWDVSNVSEYSNFDAFTSFDGQDPSHIWQDAHKPKFKQK